MKLILEQLRPGRDSVPVDETYTVLDRGEEVVVRLDGDLVVDNTPRRVVIRGDLAVHGQGTCDRCLASCAVDYLAEVAIVILREGEPESAHDEDSWLIRQTTGVVDLDDALREAIVLGRPQRTLCRDECRGICPHCGADLNEQPCDCEQSATDPRWDALP